MSELTPALAREIAEETSRIIGFNVLVTDAAGVVIGSGDPDRVGSVHEASIEVMRTRRAAEHGAEQARALHGVKPGMTLPIELDGEALGTVGITGSPARIRRFGLLVQRHTEILVREAILLRDRLVRDRAIADFLRDLALFDDDTVTGAALAQRAAELGIDLDRPRVVLVLDLPAATGAVARTVREVCHDPHDVFAETSAGRFTVLHGAERLDDARQRCAELLELLRAHHDPAARIGLSDPAIGIRALHDACHDAALAPRIASGADAALAPRIASGKDAGLAPRIVPGADAGLAPRIASQTDNGVFAIADLRVPQVLASAGHHARARFVELLVGPLRTDPDWPTQRDTLIAWARSGFNLVRAADALHIHRNTLLYRLDRITQRCGRPVREPDAALALYFACVAQQVTTEPGPASRASGSGTR